MKKAYWPLTVAFILCVSQLTACSKLMGNLRRDLRDPDEAEYSEPPVQGGRWAERGFLNEDMPEAGAGGDRYASVGHAERDPASASPHDVGSWVSDEQMDANRRDQARSVEGGDNADQPVANENAAPARKFKNGARATRADFVDESTNEGSLWASDGQTNYYFTKNKIRGVGDILTITADADLVRDIGVEVRRGLTPVERNTEYTLAQERIRNKAMGIQTDVAATSAAAPDRAPASAAPAAAAAGTGAQKNIDDADLPAPKLQDLDVASALQIKAADAMMGEIIERYPNGNYKVRATKRVNYKNGAPRMVTLIGIAKGTDIGEDDTIASGKLYEYRIEAVR